MQCLQWVASPVNVYLRTRKRFESAVDFPVAFVIGCVQSGKVLSPEGCSTVKSLPAFTSHAVSRVCALYALQTQRAARLYCGLVVAL